MIKILLKNGIINGVGFVAIMTIIDLIRGEQISFGSTLLMFLFFGTVMSVFLFILLKRELKKRGINTISEKEIYNLNENTSVQISSIDDVIQRIENSNLKIEITEKIIEDRIILSPVSMNSDWGDPIHLIKTEIPNVYKLKAKRKILSPEICYFKNALNIKEIKEILTA